MRTFFAIPVDKQILTPVLPILTTLKETAQESISWKDPRDWHITLRFLGEINHEQLETLVLAARRIAQEFEPAQLRIKKLAPFPLSSSPHIALHLVPNSPLRSLVDKLDGAALTVGLNKDQRRFRPHITLGKFVNENDRAPFSPMSFDSFDIPFEELVLYASKTQADGSHYRALQFFRFHKRGDSDD